MDIREAAQIIRDTVSMDAVLGFYGYTTRHGFMPCPFHGDRNASLKVYPKDGGWHCFGCGRGGSVIDFVMEHEGCGFTTAVKAIDAAMNMGLMIPEDPLEESSRRALTANLDGIESAMLEYIQQEQETNEYMITYWFHELQKAEEKPKEKRTAQEWTRIQMITDSLERLEDEQREYETIREGVIEWRKRSRSRMSNRARRVRPACPPDSRQHRSRASTYLLT